MFKDGEMNTISNDDIQRNSAFFQLARHLTETMHDISPVRDGGVGERSLLKSLRRMR